MQTVGQVVRQRREALGLTLGGAAAAAGVAKSYLSMIENHRVGNPPSRGLLESLERVLGIPPGELLRVAEWQVTPEGVRREVRRLGDDARRGRELAAWLRSAASARKKGGKDLDALYRSGQLGKRLSAVLTPPENTPAVPASAGPSPTASRAPAPLRFTPVPLINKVAAGRPAAHTDLGYPDGTSDDHVPVPPLPADVPRYDDDTASPAAGLPGRDCFAAVVTGRSMEPAYREGDIIVCSASAKVEDGCDCFVRLEPDHEVTFKRVYFDEAGGVIRLQPLNPDFAAKVVDREEVAGMYRAVWRYCRV